MLTVSVSSDRGGRVSEVVWQLSGDLLFLFGKLDGRISVSERSPEIVDFVSFWQKTLFLLPIPVAVLSKWQTIDRKPRLVQPLFDSMTCRTSG